MTEGAEREPDGRNVNAILMLSGNEDGRFEEGKG
jgi:hypothetical protein